MKQLKIILPIISIIMLLLAIPKGLFPYSYNLLRFVVCGTGVFLAVISYKGKNTAWAWTMGMVALIFNPIFHIHLGKEIWVVIDIVIAIIFSVYLFIAKSGRGNNTNTKRKVEKEIEEN